MKATSRGWIFCAAMGVVAAGLFLAGCAVSHSDFATSGMRSSTNERAARDYFQPVHPIGTPMGLDELWIVPRDSALPAATEIGSGTLLARVEDYEMPMPLTHTDVKASVNGYIGTVEVTQRFENPHTTTIEAAYVFPLPHNAAIHDFIMTIGKRRIRGIIRERKEAEAIYEEAKRQGYRATLLTEDRPNIFKQSVANIGPGAQIEVHIQYIQTIDYADGWYEFVFPMAGAQPASGSERDGQDISLHVDLDAGVPIEELESKTHAITKTVLSPNHFAVQLAQNAKIPNQDFVLRYRVAGQQIRSSLMTHRDERRGYFTLMLYPPREVENPRHPALTQIRLDAGTMQTFDVFPRQIPDLFYGRAVAITGRFKEAGTGKIRVTGNAGNRLVEFDLPAQEDSAADSGLPNIWARMKIADLVEQTDYAPNPQLPYQINQVALDYGLVSPFTGFVTVDASGE